jgi:hypothetical protein
MQESRVLHLRNPPVFSRFWPICALVHGQEADTGRSSEQHSKSSAMLSQPHQNLMILSSAAERQTALKNQSLTTSTYRKNKIRFQRRAEDDQECIAAFLLRVPPKGAALGRQDDSNVGIERNKTLIARREESRGGELRGNQTVMVR